MSRVDELFGLTGRTALVTGARSGIGRACAVALASAGADIVCWGRDRLDGIVTEIESLGRQAWAVTCDMTDLTAVTATARDVLGERPVDILVNNAGTIRRTAAEDTSTADWREVVGLNLDAQFVLSREVGRTMLAREQGRIVNVASLLSFQGGLRVPAYAASKHAVAGLTKALANEWGGRGVTVNAVAPGYIESANTQALRSDPDRERAIRQRIPIGRWGVPAEVAGAVVFLAGPAANYVNGHVLVVDGGWMAR